jgi:hypothetical protein
MFDIPIYRTEANDGLAKIIQANASIAYCSLVEPNKINESNIQFYISEGSKKFDLDTLYPTKSVLVSSNWNKNDDIFGLKEIWAARHTPVHKPTNIDHDHKQIVGHITDTWVVDSEGEAVADDSVIDDLPPVIHICNGAVIYRHYTEENLRDRAAELIEQIEAGTKYVSMECLFPDFDYGVISPEGDNYVIARNEETAFLTKHLRAYGGEGKFNGYQIGRFLKDMVFSGKGYVDQPANPDSVIFTDDKPNLTFSCAVRKNDFIFKNGVNNIISETPKMSTANSDDSKEIIMSETIDFYKTELAEAKKQNAELAEVNKQLNVSVASTNLEQLKAEIEKLTAKVEAITSEKEEVKAELTEAKTSFDAVTVSLKEMTESKEALEKAVEEAKSDKIFADRVSSLIDSGLTKEKAEATVTQLAGLTDEQFEAAKSLLGEIKADASTDVNNEDGEADLETALDNAEATDSADEIGSTESEDTDDVSKVRQSLASYFATSLNVKKDSNE